MPMVNGAGQEIPTGRRRPGAAGVQNGGRWRPFVDACGLKKPFILRDCACLLKPSNQQAGCSNHPGRARFLREEFDERSRPVKRFQVFGV
jgi:hypothetical protein